MRLMILLLINFPTIVLASGSGHEVAVPYKMILIQAINLSLGLGILVYFTRKVIAEHFETRHKDFHAEVEKAETAKKDADIKKMEISEKISKLQGDQQSTLAKAKADAATMKEKIIHDAGLISKKLAEDAVKTSEFERLLAIEDLRQELLLRSLDMAQEKMKDEVDGSDLKRMRTEFVEKIQVVQ